MQRNNTGSNGAHREHDAEPGGDGSNSSTVDPKSAFKSFVKRAAEIKLSGKASGKSAETQKDSENSLFNKERKFKSAI